MQKQSTLKPQDLFATLKVCVTDKRPTYVELSEQLGMSPSEVHAALRRAAKCRLLIPEDGWFEPNRSALREFLIHGVKYVFPLITGGITRGIPTSASAPPLINDFGPASGLPLVWPDDAGDVRGIAVVPLYPSVPLAARRDAKFYALVSLVDALRGGSARERELANEYLRGALT